MSPAAVNQGKPPPPPLPPPLTIRVRLPLRPFSAHGIHCIECRPAVTFTCSNSLPNRYACKCAAVQSGVLRSMGQNEQYATWTDPRLYPLSCPAASTKKNHCQTSLNINRLSQLNHSDVRSNLLLLVALGPVASAVGFFGAVGR